jgi:thiol-disulfide isomerase/thioredoxin
MMRSVLKATYPKIIFIVFVITLFPATGVNAEMAPKFFISNLEGKRIKSKQENRILISFFFVDCLPCRKEIPQLYKLVTEEKLNTVLLYIDPLSSDSANLIKDFANDLDVPIKYFYHDSLGRLTKKFFKGQSKFPTIVGIKNRQIIFTVNDLSETSVAKIVNEFKE